LVTVHGLALLGVSAHLVNDLNRQPYHI
jgi:hypothetical protein